jgi:tetratricopeptide (TPR) repeat protein
MYHGRKRSGSRTDVKYVALGWITLFLAAAPAVAEEWLEASSDHFVIYSAQRDKVVKDFAERLERFHGAMEQMFGGPVSRPGPSNRVTVYVLPSAAKVRRVLGTGDRYLSGVYMPRAGGSIALIPRLQSAVSFQVTGETILYHEYAHHFMHSLTNRSYPRWFTEGFAEFFATAMFREDGSVVIGGPANYRASELFNATHVPIRKFLSFDGGVADAGPFDTAFYGQSWVLFHYLQRDPGRSGQWAKYVSLLGEGRAALDAAEAAFGDLNKLKKDMDLYMRRGTLSARVIRGTTLTVGPISVRKLRPGEAEMMPTMIESKVGVTREEAVELLPEARKVAGRHPDDAAVLTALAEAEFDAGNDDAAIAAADAALAIDPQRVNAHIQKGHALSHKVESGVLPKEAWKDVRLQFVEANRVEHDHPVPLVQFYLTYVKQGVRPTKNAIDGLEWALTLAPFDASLRWLVAQEMVADERYQEAAQVLGPLAYSPHPGQDTQEALKLLRDVEARLASGKDSAPQSPQSQ